MERNDRFRLPVSYGTHTSLYIGIREKKKYDLIYPLDSAELHSGYLPGIF